MEIRCRNAKNYGNVEIIMKQAIVNGKIVDQQKICNCGQIINWTIYPTEKLLGFYCNACGYKSDLQPFEEYVNPALKNAPWRTI